MRMSPPPPSLFSICPTESECFSSLRREAQPVRRRGLRNRNRPLRMCTCPLRTCTFPLRALTWIGVGVEGVCVWGGEPPAGAVAMETIAGKSGVRGRFRASVLRHTPPPADDVTAPLLSHTGFSLTRFPCDHRYAPSLMSFRCCCCSHEA